ncbi:SDR family oxidoreductase [Paenibacillus alkalitolerans]|uniref:hypothetical protein n=1 Tax=Paenibacillus alkalitolerans TaxID=2799335 RepID=UPI0018F28BE3|nr:hypothetical protein [Paenibacillus alkalitolerans]
MRWTILVAERLHLLYEQPLTWLKTQKIALVTEGSRGLGRNSAIALSRKGFDVIVTRAFQSRRVQLGYDAAAGDRFLHIRCEHRHWKMKSA